MQSCYQNILEAMKGLEIIDRPCLSRAIENCRSPATGEPRAVFDALPVLPELPREKEGGGIQTADATLHIGAGGQGEPT